MHINKAIKEYQLKNGEKRFMFKIYLGINPLTGKEITTTRRGFKKPKEAQLAYDRLKFQFNEGNHIKEQYITYQEVYEEWVVKYKKDVEASTFVKTTGIFKNHILPAMGAYRISKINFKICKQHVDEWKEKLVNFKTVKFYASKVLDHAVINNNIQSNPFKLVETPKKRKKQKVNNFYSREQLIEFLNAYKNEGNLKLYTFFRLLSFAGMRKSEALALTWGDVDFSNNTLELNKAIAYGEDNIIYVKDIKTHEIRNLKIDQQTMTTLKNWLEKQTKQLNLFGIDTKQSKQLVFHNTENKHIHPTATWDWVNDIRKKYNLKYISTHGFRHTHATLLSEAGARLEGIQQRLGHSGNDTTTNTYIHVTEIIKKETLEQFIEYMNY